MQLRGAGRVCDRQARRNDWEGGDEARQQKRNATARCPHCLPPLPPHTTNQSPWMNGESSVATSLFVTGRSRADAACCAPATPLDTSSAPIESSARRRPAAAGLSMLLPLLLLVALPLPPRVGGAALLAATTMLLLRRAATRAHGRAAARDAPEARRLGALRCMANQQSAWGTGEGARGGECVLEGAFLSARSRDTWCLQFARSMAS